VNILFLVHRAPFPPDKGDRIRSYRLLLKLREHGRVHLATLSDGPAEAHVEDALRGLCAEVAVVPLDKRRWLRASASLVGGRSATEGLFASGRLRRQVETWLRAKPFGAAVAFCSALTPYLPGPELGVPCFADLVDVDSEKWLQYAADSFGPKSWLYALEGRRVRRLELELCRRVRRLAITTHPEAELLRSFAPDAPVAVVPNGVDLEYFAPSVDPAPEPNTCCFVGAMDYRANVDGVTRFVRDVWPKVLERRPDARFRIVGRDPTPAVRDLASVAGVEVTGSVPDVRPWVARSAVGVAPLAVARGVQNKILETLALGRPMIATPSARDGLHTEDGRDLLVARSADEWVSALVELWGDPARRRALAERGRAYVEARHRWDRCFAPWDAWFDECRDVGGNPAKVASAAGRDS
jgi:sugar transferase (PEP-CTERM/EpsH1 system associated)